MEMFNELLGQLSNEEILAEYLNYARKFPDLLDVEKNKVLEKIKSELGIDKILNEIDLCNFENILHQEKGSQLIKIYMGKSHRLAEHLVLRRFSQTDAHPVG